MRSKRYKRSKTIQASPPVVPMGKVIARRTLTRVFNGGRVTISLGTPVYVGGGWDWAVRFRIAGLGKKVEQQVHGVDAFQALHLAITQAVRAHLEKTGEEFEFLGGREWRAAFPLPLSTTDGPGLEAHLRKVISREETAWMRKSKTRSAR